MEIYEKFKERKLNRENEAYEKILESCIEHGVCTFRSFEEEYSILKNNLNGIVDRLSEAGLSVIKLKRSWWHKYLDDGFLGGHNRIIVVYITELKYRVPKEYRVDF